MRYLFFISTLFFLLGCVKDGKNIHVRGCAWDPVLKVGKPNIEVLLYKETVFDSGGAPGFDSGSGGNKLVASTTTDSNGYFEIFHLGGLARYKLQVDNVPPGHFVGRWSDEKLANRVKKGKTTNVDYYLLEKQNFHKKYINANCEGESDSMSMQVEYLETYYQRPTVINPYLGCSVIETNSSSVLPGTWRFSWKVYRPSGVTEGSQIVEVGEGDSEFILEY